MKDSMDEGQAIRLMKNGDLAGLESLSQLYYLENCL
jgi:hypothetical protein